MMSDWTLFNSPGLGSRQTIRVIQPGQQRVKVFVDFWNVIINSRKQTNDLQLDFNWNRLADFIVSETYRGHSDESSTQIAGCYIFGSYSRSNGRESAFIDEVLDRYASTPGLFFEFRERVKKEVASKCPNCGEQVSKSSELGIDVLLSVEMIKHASMREHEFLALVSSDRDYLPLLSYLKDQGQRVLHFATGEAHRDMRSLTWKQTKLEEAYVYLCSISHEHRLLLTSPQSRQLTQEATRHLENLGLTYKLIDISSRDDIDDKDLKFLLANLQFFFRKRGNGNQSFSGGAVAGSVTDLRQAIANGDLTTSLPYVIYHGQMEAFADEHGRWIRNASDSSLIWTNVPKRNA
jgi:hypothetical protein